MYRYVCRKRPHPAISSEFLEPKVTGSIPAKDQSQYNYTRSLCPVTRDSCCSQLSFLQFLFLHYSVDIHAFAVDAGTHNQGSIIVKHILWKVVYTYFWLYSKLHGLWNPEVQFRIYKGSPVIPILSRINQIPRIDTYFFKIRSNNVLHLCLGLPKSLFPVGLSN